MDDNLARIFAIDRLSIETDGQGVRALVCFCECPLECEYCLNYNPMIGLRRTELFSPESLLKRLMIDDIYIKASSGGVTFGGGEPALQSRFIGEFKRICPPDWTIYIETSLNVPSEHIQRLANLIDYWIIDIKDIKNKIYRKYTGKSNKRAIKNLKYLIKRGLSEKIMVRVPEIPEFNTKEDVEKSVCKLNKMGVTSIQRFVYSTSYQRPKPLMGIPRRPFRDLFEKDI
jgi:pyruvate formate lyase activating enzyme